MRKALIASQMLAIMNNVITPSAAQDSANPMLPTVFRTRATVGEVSGKNVRNLTTGLSGLVTINMKK